MSIEDIDGHVAHLLSLSPFDPGITYVTDILDVPFSFLYSLFYNACLSKTQLCQRETLVHPEFSDSWLSSVAG